MWHGSHYIIYFYIFTFSFLLFFFACNSAFEQGHMEPWRYINAFIIIIFLYYVLVIVVDPPDLVSDPSHHRHPPGGSLSSLLHQGRRWRLRELPRRCVLCFEVVPGIVAVVMTDVSIAFGLKGI